MYMYTSAWVSIHVPAYINACMYVRPHTYVRTYVCMYVRTYMGVWAPFLHVSSDVRVSEAPGVGHGPRSPVIHYMPPRQHIAERWDNLSACGLVARATRAHCCRPCG